MQERSRRAQRHNLEGDDVQTVGIGELRIGDAPVDMKPGSRVPTSGISPLPAPKDPVSAPPVKKSGLGRQFGRLGGAVSGKSRRNQ